ncbi:hypothetical protein [Variovorax sp. LT1R16]|uniref:hypothetical protein n=1 Tax=Variovorax sp. LT1R16 TaxID=3443728 RepID=UPI003F446409
MSAGCLFVVLGAAALAVIAPQLIVAAGGAIASIDVNPVLVAARGEGAVVVDALIERGD